MNLIEILLVSVGLSLDVFAVVVCQGAVLLKIEKAKLFKMCLLFCAWQACAVFLGHMLTAIPYLSVAATGVRFIWELIAVCIFIGLGCYMVYKAWKKEQILEHRSEINYKTLCVAAFFTSIDAFAAGIGFGFMKTQIMATVICILIVTVVTVIAGLITGYRLGYEEKTKAYGIGGILLFIAAIELAFRYIA